MNYPKYFGIFLWLLFSSGFVVGQTYYVKLNDATGTRSVDYDVELESAASTLSGILEIPNLRVYDFGFYLHTDNFEGGIPAVFEQVVSEVEALSEFYILIGRQSTNTSINEKFWIDVSLPVLTTCYVEEEIVAAISNYFNSERTIQGPSFIEFEPLEISGIEYITELLGQVYVCCEDPNSNARELNLECSATGDKIDLSDALEALEIEKKVGYYVAPTGKIIRLEGEIENRTFYRNSGGRNPLGALLSFTLDNINYHAYTDINDILFKGYKSEDGKLAPLPEVALPSSDLVEVIAGIQYNTDNCKNKIYTFYYSKGSQTKTDPLGGKDQEKLEKLGLDFSPQSLVLKASSSSGLDNYISSIDINEAVSYFGNSTISFGIDYYKQTGIPCPDRQITESELRQLQGNDYTVYKNGSYIHRTNRGYFYWQIQPDGNFYIYILDPGSLTYIPFTPPGHYYLLPGDAFESLLIEVIQKAQEPHVYLAVVGATDIPVLSQIADVADGVIYYMEGQTGEAILAIAGTIPAAYAVLKGGKYLVKLGNRLLRYGSKFDEIKAEKEALENFIGALNLNQFQSEKITELFKESSIFTRQAFENRETVRAWKIFDDAGISLKLDDPELLGDFEKLQQLAADLKSSSAFRDALVSVPGRVKAWKVVDDIGTNPAWRTHIPLLEKLDGIMSNPTLLNKIGGEAKLTDILKKNSASPYAGCNCGQQWYPNIEETVEALGQFANKFNQAKVNSLVSGLSNTINSFRRGAVQELKGIRNQIDEIVDVQVTLPGTSRIADAQLTNGRWKEIKSTSNILQKVGTDDLPQFKAYIQNVTDIGDLKYAFDKEFLKAPATAGGLGLADDLAAINHAREQMRLVFKNNAQEIFNANPGVFTKFDDIDDWGDLFDLASSSNFVDNPIIKNLVEIQ